MITIGYHSCPPSLLYFLLYSHGPVTSLADCLAKVHCSWICRAAYSILLSRVQESYGSLSQHYNNWYTSAPSDRRKHRTSDHDCLCTRYPTSSQSSTISNNWNGGKKWLREARKTLQHKWGGRQDGKHVQIWRDTGWEERDWFGS